jgi:TM2 domain-containing membrane protein YozV
MSEPAPISLPLGEPSLSHESSFGTKRRVLAAALSAIVPGAGQILLGQRSKGVLLLLTFAAILIGFWPLRLLRFYAGLVLVFGAWFALYLYAAPLDGGCY